MKPSQDQLYFNRWLAQRKPSDRADVVDKQLLAIRKRDRIRDELELRRNLKEAWE